MDAGKSIYFKHSTQAQKVVHNLVLLIWVGG